MPEGSVHEERRVAWKTIEEFFVDVKAFTAVGDGTTDDIVAFNAAMASFGSGSTGGKIRIPPGTFYLSDNLVIAKQLHIDGAGGVDSSGYATTLKFADGKGIHVYHSSDSPSGGDGSWSVLSNFRVAAAAKTILADGLYVSGHQVRVENVNIYGFKGNGIRIEATAPTGNANCWRLDSCRITGCDSNGVLVDGADSNSGTAINVDCTSNGGFGIYDSSFLGNTYIGCHTDSNTLGAYKSDDNNARNVFLGCYSESGQPASSMVYPTLVVGGLHGAGFTSGSTMSYVSNALGILQATRGVGTTQTDSGTGNVVTTTIGNDPVNGDVLLATHSADAPSSWRLKHDTTVRGLEFNYANGSGIPFRITGPSTAITFGRAAAVPYAFYTNNLWIGNGTNARHQEYGAGAPGSGAFGAGDIVWNNAPSVGNPIGWMCTVAGTPGTWVAMANL